jgi:hypothetical protein
MGRPKVYRSTDERNAARRLRRKAERNTAIQEESLQRILENPNSSSDEIFKASSLLERLRNRRERAEQSAARREGERLKGLGLLPEPKIGRPAKRDKCPAHPIERTDCHICRVLRGKETQFETRSELLFWCLVEGQYTKAEEDAIGSELEEIQSANDAEGKLTPIWAGKTSAELRVAFDEGQKEALARKRWYVDHAPVAITPAYESARAALESQ